MTGVFPPSSYFPSLSDNELFRVGVDFFGRDHILYATMGLGKIGKISPLQVFQRSERPSRILEEPIPKIKGPTDPEEREHQALLDAHLLFAKMKHSRNVLEIILQGKNHA